MPAKAQKVSQSSTPGSQSKKGSTPKESTAEIPSWADDEEAPFPRGGAQELTPLEYQAIARAAKRDAVEEHQVSRSAGNKRVRGKDATSQQEVNGETRALLKAHTLHRRNVVPGIKLLAAVVDVSSSRLLVEIPGRMVGRIAREEVSDELHELCKADEDAPGLPDLRKLFKVGEVLLCAVIPLTSRGHPSAVLELSLRLSLVQAPALSLTAKLRVGSPIWATLDSKQEYGYIMKTGAAAGGFLHKDKWNNRHPSVSSTFAHPPSWRSLLFSSAATLQPRRPLQLAALGESGLIALPTDAALRFESLLPGMLVSAKVSGLLSDGLRVVFCGYFEGTIREEQLGTSSADWARKFKLGMQLTARILWVAQEGKLVALSLLPHLLACRSFEPPPAASVGAVLDATVGFVVRKGALLSLSADGLSVSLTGLIADTQLKELEKGQKAEDVLKKLRPGATMQVVVTAVRWLDGMLEVSAKPSKLGLKTIKYEDLHAGDVVRAHVVRIDSNGLRLRVGEHGSVLGKCRLEDVSDQRLAKPLSKFSKGQAVECIVLECDPSRAKLLLSLKQSLISSKLPRILSWENIKVGTETHGVVSAVRPRSLQVAFLNGVTGIVRGSELQATLGAVWETDPHSCYREGQVVQVRVVRCDPMKKKLLLSFLSAEDMGAHLGSTSVTKKKAVTRAPGSALKLAVGSMVNGRVDSAGTAGYWVAIGQGDGFVMLPYTHLSDHPAAAAALSRDGSSADVWRAALSNGSELEHLMVISSSAETVVVTSKPSLIAAQAAGMLPSESSQVDEGSMFVGHVTHLQKRKAVIELLGGLRCVCPADELSDISELEPADMLQPGQTVLAVAQKVRKDGTVVVSLKPSSCIAAAQKVSEGAPLPSLVSSFLNDRMRLATALAKTNGVEMPLATIKLGDVLELLVAKTGKDGTLSLTLPGSSGVTALCAPEHLTDGAPSRGSLVMCRVLDIEPLTNTLQVSLRADLLAAAKPAKKGKRKSTSSMDGTSILQPAVVEYVSPASILVLSLPEHGMMLGVASAHDHWNTCGAGMQHAAACAARFPVGRKVRAKVELVGDPKSPLVLTIADEALMPIARSATRSKKVPGLRWLTHSNEAKAGVHALARPLKLTPTCIATRLDRKGAIRGRIHFTELVDFGTDVAGAFPASLPSEPMHVVLLGGREGKTGKSARSFELSTRPSELRAEMGSTPSPRLAPTDLQIGQQANGWVQEVNHDGIWVALSYLTRGRVAAMDASEDPAVVADLEAHFRFGQPVVARVVQVEVEFQVGGVASFHDLREVAAAKRWLAMLALKSSSGCVQLSGEGAKCRVRLSLRPACQSNDTSERSSSKRQRLETSDAILPKEGSVIPVKIVRAHDGRGYEVELSNKLHSRVHITEISDEWVDKPLATFPVGQVIDALVLPNGLTDDVRPKRIELSLRKRAIAAATKGKEDKDPRPMTLADVMKGELVRGYVKAVSARGAFVSLSHCVDGFIGLKHLSDDFIKEEDVEKFLKVGQLVVARVLLVDQTSNRLQLSLRQSDVTGGVFKDTAVTLRFEDIQPGMVVKGRVRRVADFGVFVRLQNSTVDALCHVSELADTKVHNPADAFREGANVKVVVLRTNPEKKQVSISMKPSQLRELGAVESDEEEAEDDEPTGDAGEADGSIDATSDLSADDEELESDGNEEEEEEVDEEDEQEDDDNESDEEESEPEDELAPGDLHGLRAKSIAPPVAMHTISGGFDWDDFETADHSKATKDAADSAVSTQHSTQADGQRARKLKERKTAHEKEVAVARREEELLDDSQPQSAEAFERLLLGSPNSSYLWLRYMQFQLSLTEIDRARDVAERALKKIDLTKMHDRFNIWAAWLNLEKAHGDEATFASVFQRALQGADPKQVHLHVAATHERAGDIELTDAAYEATCKKFKQSTDVWIAWMTSAMQRGEHAHGKDILQRSINVLPTAQHVTVISKFAQLEFKHGSPERGRTIFDGVLTNYPKRVDIWSIYIDMELRHGEDEAIKRLFERVTSLRLSSKKMKFFFSRYLKYARDTANADLVQHVKEKARQWVETAAQAY